MKLPAIRRNETARRMTSLSRKGGSAQKLIDIIRKAKKQAVVRDERDALRLEVERLKRIIDSPDTLPEEGKG